MEEEKKELDENFLSRWAQKKSKQKSDKAHSKIENEVIEKSLHNKDSNSIREESKENDNLDDNELLKKYNLPNPEKIKKEKYLDVFFKEGVPDRLRQIALRRVWRLNPIIRFADAEINDYHEDFTDAATVIEGMETAYKVGKGYLSDLIDGKDDKNDDEALISTKISTKKNNKKKTKKDPKAKNINKKRDNELKQITEHDKKNIKTINEINEVENLNEQLSTAKPENKNSLENIKHKIKPETMVFKPKKSDNDYH